MFRNHEIAITAIIVYTNKIDSSILAINFLNFSQLDDPWLKIMPPKLLGGITTQIEIST